MEELGISKPWKTNFNVGNVKLFARKCGIEETMSLDLDQLLARYREKDHTKEVLLRGKMEKSPVGEVPQNLDLVHPTSSK